MRKTTALLTILATSLVSYAAVAQDEAAPPQGAPPAAPPPEGAPPAAPAPEAAAPAAAPAGYPDEYALRPLTLSAGMFQAKLPILVNLSKNNVGKPVAIPIELRYGITDQLELTLYHPVYGLCVTGKSKGCEKVYNDIALGATFSFLKDNGIELAGLLALEFTRLSSPMYMDIDVGVAFKYIAAPVSVSLAPQVAIAANKRSDLGREKQAILVPLQIAFQAAPQITPFLSAGIVGPTDHFGDLYMVPVGIGANFLVQHALDVGIELVLPAVLAGSAWGSDVKGVNSRVLGVYAAWRSM